MRFHLIDRVDEWQPERSVRARKLTSHSEELWEPDGGGVRLCPPLILEALCQAGTWLIMLSTERRKRAALLSVGAVAWGEPVRPGDVMEMRCTVDSWGEQAAVISGEVTVGDRVVLAASEVMCALMDADELADFDDMARLERVLTRAAA
jgi:3-hydroxyacyl-[acyl-carrier-protein] dehydratase